MLQVTLTFSEDDVKEILQGINDLITSENPITIEEVKANPKLQQYLISQLENSIDEIVEGSYDAAANDWCADINEHRGDTDE